MLRTWLMKMVYVACIIEHNLCMIYSFFHIFTFSWKIFNHFGRNFSWAFVMIMRCWICKTVTPSCMIKSNYGQITHKSCIIFFHLFVKNPFYSKIDIWDRFLNPSTFKVDPTDWPLSIRHSVRPFVSLSVSPCMWCFWPFLKTAINRWTFCMIEEGRRAHCLS